MGWFDKVKSFFIKDATNTKTLSYLGNGSLLVNPDKEFNATYTNCAEVLASHVSKLKIQVINRENSGSILRFKYLNRLLQFKPNIMQTASNFLHTLAYDYYFYGVAFAFVDWDYSLVNGRRVKGIYPVSPISLSSVVERNGDICFKFQLTSGRQIYCKSDEMIYIAKTPRSDNPIQSNNSSLNEVLNVLATNNAGMVKAIENANSIRFIVSQAGLVSDKVRQDQQQAFEKQMAAAKSLLVVGNSTEVKQITSTSRWIEEDSIKELKNEVYGFFGINEDFVKGKYTETEYQSIFESAIDPLITALSQELTNKLFTDREFEVGNRVEILSDPLQVASLDTRIKVAEVYLKLPLIVPNRVNDLLYLPRTENGDKEVQSLNYVNSTLADKYQVGEDGTDNKEDVQDGKEDQ